jgi:Protein of unknown function (DUF3750)
VFVHAGDRQPSQTIGIIGALSVPGRSRELIVLALAAWTTGCVLAPRSLDPPPNDQTTVALLTGTLPAPLDEIARHPWFAVRTRGATEWTVYEVGGGGTEEDPFRHHEPYGNPIVHKVWRGAEAERAAACLARESSPWQEKLSYRFYPGPNSNTFGDVMLRMCDLHASLPSTSIGKDWRGVIGGGVTSEGTGLQVETPLVGVKLGLKEGIEVHILGLSIGIDLWPPAIILPLGPGRLGFADR